MTEPSCRDPLSSTERLIQFTGRKRESVNGRLMGRARSFSALRAASSLASPYGGKSAEDLSILTQLQPTC
jgi:hypothetical protein